MPIPCVVEGKLQQGEDVDCYKLHAAAGQEIVFTALCARLEDHVHDLNTHADPLLILTDSAGKEITRNDDYYGADPLLAHRFEAAGDYVLQILDVNYQGNPHWVYRLTMTDRSTTLTLTPSPTPCGTPSPSASGCWPRSGGGTRRRSATASA